MLSGTPQISRHKDSSVGVLVSHPSHLNWARFQWPDCILIAREQIILQLFPQEKVEYFYPKLEAATNSEHLVVFLADNWYRDDNGLDIVHEDGFSLPQVLTGSIRIGAASQIREYEAVKFWTTQLSKLYVSSLENDFLKRALEYGSIKYEFYEPPNHELPISQGMVKRSLANYLSVDKKWVRPAFLRMAYVLQRVIFPKIKQELTLIFSDWTNLTQKLNKQCLWTNHTNPQKCAYVFSSNAELKRSAEIVERQSISFVSSAWITWVLARRDFVVSSDLAELLSDCLQHIVIESKPMISTYHSQVLSLFKCYNINEIQVPSELFEPYVVALQVAQAKQVATILALDGHDPLGFGVPTLRTYDNSKFLLDKFVTPGVVLYESAKLRGFSDAQIICRDSVFLNQAQKSKSEKPKFDAIVMTWAPNNYNPDTRLDSCSKSLEVSILLLAEQFDGKLAVKVKNLAAEFEYVNSTINLTGLSKRVDILSGRFFDHIYSGGLIVGGISSAIGEAILHDIPYFVFEPYENGYSDATLCNSSALETARVARTPEGLRRLILDGQPSVQYSKSEYLYAHRERV